MIVVVMILVIIMTVHRFVGYEGLARASYPL